jgi:hypothetical protein
MSEQIKSIDDECDFLREKISQLEREIQSKTVSDTNQREEDNKKHEEFVADFRKKNAVLKEDIKTKLSSILK